jgi:DNA-binding GntR family transcriptional regulator
MNVAKPLLSSARGQKMSGIGELEPPKKQSLDRAAADSLRNAIVFGRIEPGARLTETRLAEQFMLSRGTVRAALQRLVSEGLVQQRPYSGWDVTMLSSQDAWELAMLRSALEALAARLAAERIDAAGRTALTVALDELSAAAGAANPEALVAADVALHRTVMDLSGSRRLREHYDLIANQLRPYIASSNRLVEAGDTVLARHRELVAPILAGDPDAAEAAGRAHATRGGEEIVAHLRQMEAATTPATGDGD